MQFKSAVIKNIDFCLLRILTDKEIYAGVKKPTIIETVRLG
jgi:hypothetical protein